MLRASNEVIRALLIKMKTKKKKYQVCQANYEKKRSIQSFKPKDEILKLKIKVKNIQ